MKAILSFPIVIFATIFFSTVFLFTNFLSFASAACSSARNSCREFKFMQALLSAPASVYDNL